MCAKREVSGGKGQKWESGGKVGGKGLVQFRRGGQEKDRIGERLGKGGRNRK